MNIRSVEALKDYLNQGSTVKYVFFWGHQNKGVEVSKSCFSQWYESRFEDPNSWLGLNLLGFALMEVRDLLSHK